MPSAGPSACIDALLPAGAALFTAICTGSAKKWQLWISQLMHLCSLYNPLTMHALCF